MSSSWVYLKDVVTLKLDREKCTGCGTCLLVCPHAVLSLTNGKIDIADRDACMECGACSRNCPVEALSVKSGVGCATAVINSMLGRKKDSCCNIEPSCGDAKDSEGSPGTGRSCCC
jgi:ferredoxin